MVICLHKKKDGRALFVDLSRDRLDGRTVIRDGKRIAVRETKAEIARIIRENKFYSADGRARRDGPSD
jgi:hypothetical protein